MTNMAGVVITTLLVSGIICLVLYDYEDFEIPLFEIKTNMTKESHLEQMENYDGKLSFTRCLKGDKVLFEHKSIGGSLFMNYPMIYRIKCFEEMNGTELEWGEIT